MSVSTQSLAERAVSAFPISIGTALALESILDGIQPAYDPERVPPARIELTSYHELWVNIETLFRNVLGAIPTAAQGSVLGGDILSVMFEEADLIEELVLNATHGQVKVVFYRNEHKHLDKAHPHAVLRKPSTSKQLEYAGNAAQVCGHYVKLRRELDKVKTFDRVLHPTLKRKTLMITHQAYDLLSAPQFEELDLLESHTGVLKKRSLWYTKLYHGKELARIPVNVCTMQVFGDAVTFAPQPMALRQQVLDLSEKYQWHALTSKDRMRVGFATLSDVFAGSILKSMLAEM